MTKKEKRNLLIVLILFVCFVIAIGFVDYFRQKEIKASDNDEKINKTEIVYNLPIVTIDIPKDEIVQNQFGDSNEVKAKIQIYDNDAHHNQLSQKPKKTLYAKVKIRGNSTKMVPKKQFKLNITNKNYTKEKKTGMLGMPESEEWVLNAPFEDKSLIRNALAYQIGREIMPWAPQTKFCEVFYREQDDKGAMSDYYKGVYLMIEPIKRGKDRINIDKSDPDYNQTSFIVQQNTTRGETSIANSFGKENYLYDYPFIIEYPKRSLTDGQQEYIEKTLSLFEHSIFKDKKDREYEKYIDVDSFVDYFIINEFLNNTDAGLLSTYLYKDFGSKIYAGPIWDFNACLGNSNLLSPYYDYQGFYMSRTSIYGKLLEHKEFTRKVIERYRLLRKSYLSDDRLLAQVDQLVKSLGNAPERNFKKWPIWICNQFEMFKGHQDTFLEMGDDIDKMAAFLKKKENRHYLEDTENMATSYKEEIKKMKVFIVNRGKWMDKNIQSLYDLSSEKNEGNE